MVLTTASAQYYRRGDAGQVGNGDKRTRKLAVEAPPKPFQGDLRPYCAEDQASSLLFMR